MQYCIFFMYITKSQLFKIILKSYNTLHKHNPLNVFDSDNLLDYAIETN